MAAKKSTKSVARQTCVACGEPKKVQDYYISYNEMFPNGRVPMCKECMFAKSVDEDGNIDADKFKEMLRKIDRPYIDDVFNASVKENIPLRLEGVAKSKKIFGTYFKNINSLKQYKKMAFLDSDSLNGDFGEKMFECKEENSDKQSTSKQEFEVTQDIIDLFGEGYTKNEYRKMNKKYNDMKLNYSIQTNLHQEALVTYVRFKVKEEIATAKGDVVEAQKWYSAAQDAADKAKLTPKQLTQADLQGGINSFSEIFKAVEQAVDVIPILPKFKSRPNDALDFNIWCYINYARDLQGLPPCEYKDVYKFYDKKKQEYISQYGDPYGIFDEDPSENNRESISKFITLPKDYEDGDE